MIENASSMDRPVSPAGFGRRGKIVAVAAIALAAILALLYPTLRNWSRADRAVDASLVRTARVSLGDLRRDVSAQGKVVAGLHPTLFTGATGVIALRTREGAVVRQGDILAMVESAELHADLEQARASLLALESARDRQQLASRQTAMRIQQARDLSAVKVEAARRGLARAETMFKEGLMGRYDLERAQDELHVATLEHEQAVRDLTLTAESSAFEVRDRELQVRRQASATTDLDRRVGELAIKAPFDGMIANVAVSDRDAVAANQPVLTIVNLSSFEVEITMPEEYATGAVIGTPAEITYGGREYRGRITSISPEVTASQVRGTVSFDGETPQELKQNQRVQTRIVFESRKNVLKLPRGPFVESGGGRFAFVVSGELASRRKIELGAMSVDEVEVLSGLTSGEEVVVSDTTPFGNSDTVMLRK